MPDFDVSCECPSMPAVFVVVVADVVLTKPPALRARGRMTAQPAAAVSVRPVVAKWSAAPSASTSVPPHHRSNHVADADRHRCARRTDSARTGRCRRRRAVPQCRRRCARAAHHHRRSVLRPHKIHGHASGSVEKTRGTQMRSGRLIVIIAAAARCPLPLSSARGACSLCAVRLLRCVLPSLFVFFPFRRL